MLGGLTGWHLLIILALILVLFGATRLPKLARSVGQSMRIFRSEMQNKDIDPDAPVSTKTEAAESSAPESTTK